MNVYAGAVLGVYLPDVSGPCCPLWVWGRAERFVLGGGVARYSVLYFFGLRAVRADSQTA
jgi:hypothetical protein